MLHPRRGSLTVEAKCTLIHYKLRSSTCAADAAIIELKGRLLCKSFTSGGTWLKFRIHIHDPSTTCLLDHVLFCVQPGTRPANKYCSILEAASGIIVSRVVGRNPSILDGLAQIRTPVLDLAVVDEYIGGGGGDVEVVVAGDGEVPHPAGPVAGRVAAGDGGGAACGGAQAGAVAEGAGLDPAVGGGVPERVVAGGVDDRGPAVGADGQVVPVGVVRSPSRPRRA